MHAKLNLSKIGSSRSLAKMMALTSLKNKVTSDAKKEELTSPYNKACKQMVHLPTTTTLATQSKPSPSYNSVDKSHPST